MALQLDIKKQIVEALKAKDTVRLSVLRGLSAGFTNELVALKRKPDGALTDEEALAVIKRQARQRKDSIEQFTSGGRADLAEKESVELQILEAYLPSMMAIADIKKIAEAKKNELGVSDPTQKGKLMAEIMKELKGKAEGGDVKTVVDSLF